MSKTWITLIGIAAGVLLAWTGVQFYSAVTGEGNQEFSFDVQTIENKLPEEVLNKISENDDKILVRLEQIEVEE